MSPAPRTTGNGLSTRLTDTERDRTHAPVKVRDAASLIVLDETGPSVLMGRRNAHHVFMPNCYVFPGGRVDPIDSRVQLAAGYHPDIARKLEAQTSTRYGPTRARALGVAALREAFEETGVLVAREAPEMAPKAAAFAAFQRRGLALDLSKLVFVARAVTPPGRPRRYDTRFFMVRRDDIAAIDDAIVGADGELEEIQFVHIDQARHMDLPTITLTVLDELFQRFVDDPDLSPSTPVPFYRWRGRGFTRELL